MTGPLSGQEFVAYLFVPLRGRSSAAALAQLGALWEACRSDLGMTNPIEPGLSAVLPARPERAGDGFLAGLRDPYADLEAVVRRDHDVLHFSLTLSAPATRTRRFGIAADFRPGWTQFDRWWRSIAAGGTGAMLGEVLLYTAKAEPITHAAEPDVRAEPHVRAVPDVRAVPARDDDAPRWWTQARSIGGFPCWEVTGGRFARSRRLVLLARPDEDDRFISFVWSSDIAAVPPLGNALLHAARLRELGRADDDGLAANQALLDTARDHLRELGELSSRPEEAPRIGTLRRGLVAAEAELDERLEQLGRRHRAVESALAGMRSAGYAPLPSDEALAARLPEQVRSGLAECENTHLRAGRMLTRLDAEHRRPSPPVLPAGDESFGARRVGLAVEAAGHATSPVGRLTAMARIVSSLCDVLSSADRGMRLDYRGMAAGQAVVLLPPEVRPHTMLPHLLHGLRKRITVDNQHFPEMRLRISVAVVAGVFSVPGSGQAADGDAELSHLLNCAELREAVRQRPEADVVAAVSDRLHDAVVSRGHRGPGEDQFTRLAVADGKDAWLWTGGHDDRG